MESEGPYIVFENTGDKAIVLYGGEWNTLVFDCEEWDQPLTQSLVLLDAEGRIILRLDNLVGEKERMTDDKGAGEWFAKAISKGVLNAQDLEPGMSIIVGGYVFTGKYTTWADQINREFDARIRAERERCAKIAESHVKKLNGFQIADKYFSCEVICQPRSHLNFMF